MMEVGKVKGKRAIVGYGFYSRRWTWATLVELLALLTDWLSEDHFRVTGKIVHLSVRMLLLFLSC